MVNLMPFVSNDTWCRELNADVLNDTQVQRNPRRYVERNEGTMAKTTLLKFLLLFVACTQTQIQGGTTTPWEQDIHLLQPTWAKGPTEKEIRYVCTQHELKGYSFLGKINKFIIPQLSVTTNEKNKAHITVRSSELLVIINMKAGVQYTIYSKALACSQN